MIIFDNCIAEKMTLLRESVQRFRNDDFITPQQLADFIQQNVPNGRRSHVEVKAVIISTDGNSTARAYSANHEFNVTHDDGIRLPLHADQMSSANAQQLLDDITAFTAAGYSARARLYLYGYNDGGIPQVMARGAYFNTESNVLYIVAGDYSVADNLLQALSTAVGDDQRAEALAEEFGEGIQNREQAEMYMAVIAAFLPDSALREKGLSNDEIAMYRHVNVSHPDLTSLQQHFSHGGDAEDNNEDDDEEDDSHQEAPAAQAPAAPQQQAPAAQPAPQGQLVAGMRFLGEFPVNGRLDGTSFQLVMGSTDLQHFQQFLTAHPGLSAALHPDKPYKYFKYHVNAPTGFSKRVWYMAYLPGQSESVGTFTIVDVVRGKHVTAYDVQNVSRGVFWDAITRGDDVSRWGDQIVWRRIREPAYKTSTTGLKVTYDEHHVYQSLVGVNAQVPFTVGLAVPAAQNATPLARGNAPAQNADNANANANRVRRPRQQAPTDVDQINQELQTAIRGTDLEVSTVVYVPANAHGRNLPKGMTSPQIPTLAIQFPGVDGTHYQGNSAISFLRDIGLWTNAAERAYNSLLSHHDNADIVVMMNGRYN